MPNMRESIQPPRDRIKINFVAQRYKDDCVVACIAMVTDTPYDEIMKIIDTHKRVILPLDQFFEDCLLAHFQHLPIHSLDSTLYKDRCYMISTPSLNISGGMHRVVVTTYGGDIVVYDPQSMNEGVESYSANNLLSWCEVTEIIRCRN